MHHYFGTSMPFRVVTSIPLFLFRDYRKFNAPQRYIFTPLLIDVINIDSKQSSLSYLNHQLTSITGVQDGVFLCHERDETTDGKDREARPIALVLHLVPITRKSCGHCASIFPVFIPRRLYMVNALPRNSTGKLPYQSLESMVQSLRAAQYKT